MGADAGVSLVTPPDIWGGSPTDGADVVVDAASDEAPPGSHDAGTGIA